MIGHLLIASLALVALATEADARRVALVIGQNTYSKLSLLTNPRRDAQSFAKLLARNGFDVMSCDGRRSGCFDLDYRAAVRALDTFASKAQGSDTALVFYAGHGVSSEAGNILVPVDAKVDCGTSGVSPGIPVESLMETMKGAKNKLLIIDACRNNPIERSCPALKGKKLPFTRIEAGAMKDFLLVTSTQFGQVALDGHAGEHSPFATALLQKLEAHPKVYFEQVMNEIARGTFEAASKLAPRRASDKPFEQIPGKVVGGEAPTDCLAGKDCVGDPRMAALASETERLARRVQCQSKKVAKQQEFANRQRQLLSPGPVAEIRMGDDDAPVILIEYCAIWAPFCHQYHKVNLPDLKKKYVDTGRLLYIYRDIPSSEEGIRTHMIAHCMSAADRVDFLMQLFDPQPGIPSVKRVTEIAKRLGYSEKKIEVCLSDDRTRADLEAIYKGGKLQRLGVVGIPAFFINGEKTLGLQPMTVLEGKLNAAFDSSIATADDCGP
jgi:protein-disulfide isomerase